MATTSKRAEEFWADINAAHGKQSDWLTSIAACAYAGVVKSTLLVWSKRGCPLLGGRRLRSKRCDIHGAINVYFKPDLDKILQENTSLPAPEAYRDPKWATYAQAARLAGCGTRYLRRIIPERGIASKREPAVLANGQIVDITVVSKQDIAKLASRRRPLPIPKDRISIRDAAEKLGLSHRTVWLWIRRCPHLDGRALDVVTRQIDTTDRLSQCYCLPWVKLRRSNEGYSKARHSP
jgi:hypothetical protein